MIPDLGQNPPSGARVSEGSLLVSFGLGAGNTLRLSVGTSRGANDIGSYVVTLPNTISLTVPAASVLFCSAWVTNSGDGSFHTYTWAWAVGEGEKSPSQIEHEAIVGFILDHWKRSALAEFSQGIEVADPGHGHDEISPVTYVGQSFDASNSKHIKPFTLDEVSSRRGGTGYIRCLLKPRSKPVCTAPGRRPEYQEDIYLEVRILTPKGNGAALANLYAGVLSMLFRYVNLPIAEGNVSRIRNIEMPPERATYLGADGTYRYDQLDIPLSRFGRAEISGVQ